ncbi:hypothetical protein WA1_10495 [Scytonema hofmannii PCC 7110]|uniref:Uncharacterized protein n=1 Tax=Scytonema hofmannii PCC 7110 TaxID=128403 RepID=A0A139XFL7_9CYAN|nr:hypothetical protein WA1_10495 [Scytonema hofmannii PCC 7110]
MTKTAILIHSGFTSSLQKAVTHEVDLPEQKNFIELASMFLAVFCAFTFLIPIARLTYIYLIY